MHLQVPLLLVVLLVAAVAGQTQRKFAAAVTAYNDPNVKGTLTGSMLYDADLQKLRFNWAVGVNEIYHFAESLRYLKCPAGVCETETFNVPLWEFFTTQATQQGANANINGRTCTPYKKNPPANAPANRVDIVWVDSGNSNIVCRVEFFKPAGQAAAKTLDFTANAALPANAATLFDDTVGCPQQQCSKQITFDLIFDQSGSVDANSFQLMKTFAKSLAQSYTFGPEYVGMGLTMFSTSAQQYVAITFSQTSFINGVNGVIQDAGWTCIGCGIQAGQTALANSPNRPYATPVFIVMTDGLNNRPIGQTGQLPNIVQAAKNKGIIFFSIAVADADPTEVKAISSSIPGVTTYFSSPDFTQLAGILDSLIVATCIDIPGNPCPNCEGFCSCGGTCLCPDICDDNNMCTTESCPNGPSDTKGCKFTPVVCADASQCTLDLCNPASGCYFPKKDCNDTDFCTIDSCNPVVLGGCQHLPNTCDDGNQCTTDTCNSAQAKCQHTDVVDNFCNCQTLDPCEVIPCMIGTCSEALQGQCEQLPINCDDGNACSVDTCDPKTGACAHTPVNCDTGDKCVHHLCEPVNGCYHVPFDLTPGHDCDDGSLCTTDTCAPATGCVNTPLDCSDADYCTDDLCRPASGCFNPPTDCLQDESIKNFVTTGDCYQALCSNERMGCYLQLNEGAKIDRCGYCVSEDNKNNCPDPVDSKAAIGIGAGVLAAIIIGVVIVCAAVGAFGGKKGYDIWLNKRTNMAAANTNPLYDAEDLSGTNPMYDGAAA